VTIDSENSHELAIMCHSRDTKVRPFLRRSRKDPRKKKPSKKAIFRWTVVQTPPTNGRNVVEIDWRTICLHLNKREDLEKQLVRHSMETVKWNGRCALKRWSEDLTISPPIRARWAEL
jgi:hypothetical protein